MGAKQKVLVVDDDHVVLESLRHVLVASGYEVVTRDRALGTAPAVMAEKPDVVVLDVSMPGISGDEIATLLRSNPSLRGIAVVFFSSLEPAEVAEHVKRTGALGSISKSLMGPRFVAELERLLAGRPR